MPVVYSVRCLQYQRTTRLRCEQTVQSGAIVDATVIRTRSLPVRRDGADIIASLLNMVRLILLPLTRS
jgi:ribosomal protein L14